MDSPSSEPRPEETTPLLASTRNGRDDVAEETDVIERPPTSTVQFILSVAFPICIVFAIAVLAFLLAGNLLSQYGEAKFWYYDDNLRDFTALILWTGLTSIVFSAVNIIRLKRTHKPLPALLNAIFLGIFALAVISAVVEILSMSSPTFCIDYRDYYPIDSSTDAYSNPDDPHHGDLTRRSDRGSLEECYQWVPKMQAVRETLIFLTGFYGIILSALFLTVMADVVSVIRQFIGTPFQTPNRTAISGPGGISFEVSLRWGSPQRHGTTQHRVEVVTVPERGVEVVTVPERESEST